MGILEEIVDRDDPAVVGVVLSGSAARGMATERSDRDVAALRGVFPVVDRACRAWDTAHGGTALADLIDGWGCELAYFR